MKVEFPHAVEQLTGDRDGDLQSIKGREWDGVIDLATYGPKWVRTLGEALKGRVRHYTFISTDDVYIEPSKNGTGIIDENSKLIEYQGAEDPYLITAPGRTQEIYGGLKVLCEREAQRAFPGRALIVRPSYIVGPSERLGAWVYLPARMERGGEILVAGDPLAHVQMIDVRDMAEWIVRMTEDGVEGIFNATGPAMPLGWAEMLGAIRGTMSRPMTLTWVPTEWMLEQNVKKWGNLLFWQTEAGVPGLMSTVNAKACAYGLTFRPVSVTATDTLKWYKDTQQTLAFGKPEDSIALEAQLLRAWHSRSLAG